MTTTTPHIITETNLSVAWAKALLHVHDGAGDALIVALRDFTEDLPPQDEQIATALDAHLSTFEIPRIDQTALTIIPYERLLRENRVSIDELSGWYLTQFLPRLKARCTKKRGGWKSNASAIRRFLASSVGPGSAS